MQSLPALLDARLRAVTGVDPEMRPATKPQFGHFQSNVALRLAKEQKRPPREVAADIAAQLDVSDLCEPLEIAGPGFINFRIRADVLAQAATAVLEDPHHGLSRTSHPQRVVIDYSAPNVAKQMHVGHLRTTIIGDCFNRVLTALGHEVIPQNHIGDWGTQFGMLVEHILEAGIDVTALDLAGAEQLYKDSKKHFDDDPGFATRARARVVKLQGGDQETLAIWRQLIAVSLAGFNAAYQRLGVLLTDADLAGESTYNDALPEVAADLAEQMTSPGLATILRGSYRVKERDEISSSGYVLHSLEAALWALARTDTFLDGALLAVNLGDDADTVGAIYGQLAGALYGRSAIPEGWRTRLHDARMIEDLAAGIAERVGTFEVAAG